MTQSSSHRSAAALSGASEDAAMDAVVSRASEADRSSSSSHASLQLLPFSLDKLPLAGYMHAHEVRSVALPALARARPLGIKLQQAPHAAALQNASFFRSGVLLAGQEPIIKYYMTLRRCSLSHRTMSVLTRRSARDLPASLYFDPVFIDYCRSQGLQRDEFRLVSPKFGEWLMGLPAGWTGTEPLPRCRHIHWPQWPQRFATLSLFSGIAGLDLGLAPWCNCMAYVERCPDATRILRARMADRSLEERPIFSDVRSVSQSDLPRRIDSILAGFPSFGTSVAGRGEGLQHVETGLVFHVFRLIDETQCAWVFLENVKNILNMPSTWGYLVRNFQERGFSVRWVTVEANQVGIPMRRARWFCFAERGVDLHSWVDPLDASSQVERDLWFDVSLKPHPRDWLARGSEAGASARLRMCGLSVVPMQAHLAARLLSSKVFPLVGVSWSCLRILWLPPPPPHFVRGNCSSALVPVLCQSRGQVSTHGVAESHR